LIAATEIGIAIVIEIVIEEGTIEETIENRVAPVKREITVTAEETIGELTLGISEEMTKRQTSGLSVVMIPLQNQSNARRLRFDSNRVPPYPRSLPTQILSTSANLAMSQSSGPVRTEKYSRQSMSILRERLH
jgi:hypothetical protein